MSRIVLALIALHAGLLALADAQGPPPPPPRLPAVPVPAGNPITPDKAVLGKILFWEEQLSSNNRVSCGTCHRPEHGGADPAVARHPGFNGTFNDQDDVFGSFGVRRSDPLLHYKPDASFGFNTQVTRRSSQNIFTAMYAPRLFWDGRSGGRFRDPLTNQVVLPNGAALETQAVDPPISDVEMGHEQRDWAAIATKLETAAPMKLATNLTPDIQAALARDATYPALFARAFGSPGVTPARIAMAIATYERTLVPNQTPYDAFANGNPQALTQAQHRGFRAFNGPGRCNVCHTAPLFTNNNFRAIGVRAPFEDTGRQEVTNNRGDRGRFKVPTLRNVGLKRRFMHTGEFTTLGRVIQFYRNREGHPDNRDPNINQIRLSPGQSRDIEDFLRNALTDPRVAAGQPPFDRPTLWADRNPEGANLYGRASAGSGAIVPEMLADSPPNVGNAAFKLGLCDALGGTTAVLVLSRGSATGSVGGIPFAVDPAQVLAILPIATSGTGPGNGHATIRLPLPDVPALANRTFYAQWFVVDPAAPGGVAVSRAATLRTF